MSDETDALRPDIWLLDLSAIYWPSWHATAGKDPDSPYQVSIWAVRQLAEKSPHVAACCDRGSTKRRELSAAYKGNRPDKDPAAIDQLRRLQETVRADGIPLWGCDGYEADDVIAAATEWAVRRGHRVIIATADKDLCQLVDERVSVYNTRHRQLWTIDDVRSRFGVEPWQLGDLLALCGDKSDNIAGVPGVGPKTAAAWLRACNDLPGILEAAEREDHDVVRGKPRESLLASLDVLQTSRRLVSLLGDEVTGIDFTEVLRERQIKPLQEERDMDPDPIDTQPEAPIAIAQPQHDEPQHVHVPAPVQVFDHAPAPAAIVRVDPSQWSLALEPRDAAQAYKMAGALHNSRAFKLPNQDAVFAAILLGRTLGVGALQVLRGVHYVDGKLTLSAQFLVGLVLQSNKATYFKCTECSDERASWKTHRKDDPDPEPQVESFSVADAQRAQLWGKNNWKTYPRQMLQWRAAVNLARRAYPDVVGGLYTPDELGDDSVITMHGAA